MGSYGKEDPALLLTATMLEVTASLRLICIGPGDSELLGVPPNGQHHPASRSLQDPKLDNLSSRSCLPAGLHRLRVEAVSFWTWGTALE